MAGRHFQYRTVSIWPRPQHQPIPRPTRSAPAPRPGSAARHHIGLGVSYGTFEVMAKSQVYRDSAPDGWEPGPDEIIYRANMILGQTDEAAQDALRRRDKQAAFPIVGGLRDALLQSDTTRNIAGERRPANVGGVSADQLLRRA